jgi:hypothetical protein
VALSLKPTSSARRTGLGVGEGAGATTPWWHVVAQLSPNGFVEQPVLALAKTATGVPVQLELAYTLYTKESVPSPAAVHVALP